MGARPVPVVRLTAKERILIHLVDFAKYADKPEVPPEMGQDGIARAVGIYVQHVRQFIDPLLKEGFLRERTAHVKGHRRRLKVYDLTDSGRFSGAQLREKVRADRIRVRDLGGTREMTIADALKATEGRATLADLAREALEDRVVDLSALGIAKTGPASGFVDRLAEAPRLETFVGRRDELEVLTRDGDGPRVFVVRGVAGIGKSSLAAKACERLRGSRNLYWHQIRPWDTRPSVLASLGDFLAAVGRPGLRAILSRGEADKADQVVRDDLPDTRSVLVFDDGHEATQEVFGFLRFLKEVIADAQDVRAIILSRRAVPAYDRRDVTIRGLVQEIDLEGLHGVEVQDFLGSETGGAELADVVRQLGGHPLFLELLRSSARRGVTTPPLTDVRRFVEEEIYAGLSDPERRMMKTAAQYAVPFPREAVFTDPAFSHDVLMSLTTKSLIRPVGDDAFGVHDTIRDFFVSILTPSEREALAPVAIEQLRRLADRARSSKDFVAALNCLSNALELAASRAQQADLAEALGDTYERLGDLPAAMVSYSEVIRRIEEPESVARVHRKTAAALQVRGEMARAAAEIEAGFRALGGRSSPERGWLDLMQCQSASLREEWEEAREDGESALAVFRASGDAVGQFKTLLELANVEIYSPQGKPATAEQHLMSALEISKTLGEAEFQVRSHVVLANLYAYRMGDVAGAARHIDACAALQNAITDPHILRSFLMIQAWFALYQQEDFTAAEGFFRQASALADRIHDRRTHTFANFGLAQVLFFGDRVEEAREVFRKFATDIREIGVPGDEVDALWNVAECALWLGDLDDFRQVAAKCRDPRLSHGVASRPLGSGVLEGLERLVKGDIEGCRHAFEGALRLATTSFFAHDAMLNGFVLFYWGLALQAMGRESDGKEHTGRALALLEGSGLRAPRSALQKAEPGLAAFLRSALRKSRGDST